MANLMQLRMAAREIFDETLRAVDPLNAVRSAVRRDGSQLNVRDLSIDVSNRNVYSIAIGKAAAKMAAALDDVLGEKLASGVITSSPALLAQITLSPRWQRFHGGHPEPNERSLEAARAAFHLLERANQEGALLIFLVSGGGSAMMEWPISDDLSLDDLRAANKVMVACGASIAEINSVRRAFSAVKGGRLAARAPNCDQITLIVSDVPKNEGANVASGPTLAPPNDAPSAREVITRYNLQSQLPLSIMRAVEAAEPLALSPHKAQEYFVLLDNESALQAAASAARRRGFINEIAPEISDQPIAEGCSLLMKRLESLSAQSESRGQIVCLISGGEFSCPVQGSGIGGRNLETSLRLGCSTNLSLSDTVALCAGTDGIDGNSPAAGAIIDSTTMDRANAIGIDAQDFLRRSDSYSFFVALGDVLTTGATGTNVRDVRILLFNGAQ